MRRDLETELSVTADCDVQRVSLMLGAALERRDLGTDGAPMHEEAGEAAGSPAPLPEPPAPEPTAESRAESDGSDASDLPSQSTQTPVADDGAAGASPGARPTDTPHEVADSPPPPPATPPASTPATDPSPADTGPPAQDDASAASAPSASSDAPRFGGEPPQDLKSLRARAWTLATRVAHLNRIGDVVVSIPTGLGFVVAPVPEDALGDGPPELVRLRAGTWWTLVTLSEQLARHGRAVPHLPVQWSERPIAKAAGEAAHLLRWQIEQQTPEAMADVPFLSWAELGPVLCSWPDRCWESWKELVETCRRIRSVTEDDPWR